MPKPPSLAARANRSLSVLFGGGLPVSFGIRWHCSSLVFQPPIRSRGGRGETSTAGCCLASRGIGQCAWDTVIDVITAPEKN